MLEEILERNDFFHHYQPICNIQQWNTLGYEGLFRTKDRSNPEDIFNQAKQRKKLYELDSRSIHKAFHTYYETGFSIKTEKLFLNVYPSTLMNPEFQTYINSIMEENIIRSQQIIFEISESEQIKNFSALKQTVQELKKKGILVAIDDTGKDFASFKTIIELEPNYVKLDRYYIENLRESSNKIQLIKLLLDYCRHLGAYLIVEGVEDQTTLAILKSLGVQYAQGFLLGRPELLREDITLPRI